MASAEDYANWIVKNADKKGTPEFETVAQAYQLAKSGQTQQKPQAIGAEAFPDMLRKELQDAGWMGRNIAGVGSAAVNAWEGLKGLVGNTNHRNVNEQRIIAEEAPVGNIVGNVAMLAPTALIPGANTITGAALINAAAGGVLAPGNLEERGKAALGGGAGGAAGVGIGKGIGWGYRAAKATAEPLTAAGRDRIAGRLLLRSAGENADDVAARMAGATELVPGSAPTAAEVANSGGIAALQRAMSAASPESYTTRGQQQAAARLAALRGIAGDENALQTAIKARSDAADSLYQRAYDSDLMRQDVARQELERQALAKTGGIQVVNPTKGAAATGNESVREVVNDPAMLQYLGIGKQADQFAIGKPIASPVETAAKMAPKGPGFAPVAVSDMPTPGLKSLAERPVFQAALADAQESMLNRGIQGVPINSLKGLHLTKLSIDEALNGSAPASSLAKFDRDTLRQIKTQLVEELKAVSPLYDNARQTFSQMSEPINQMQVGQFLLNKVQPALAKHGALAREAGNQYATALNDVRGNLVKNATGGMKKDLEKVMSPEQMQTLNAIAQDLARKSNAQELGRGVGSNTFQNLALDNMAAQAGVPSALSLMAHFIPGAPQLGGLLKTAGGVISQPVDQMMRQRVAEVLLDPKQAAKLMEQAKSQGLLTGKLAKYVGNDPEKLAGLLNQIGATRGVVGGAVTTGLLAPPSK